ncbi:MAG: hypothetical protein S0880_18905 [Actinomycetota bacterium]|nr:hypothetical protein [Actinomycetota bacterium]
MNGPEGAAGEPAGPDTASGSVPADDSTTADRPWFERLPPLVVEVVCEGRDHRVEWRDGTLSALDHDPEVEAAFLVLGGDEPPCLEILDRWEAAGDEPSSVELWRLQGWPPSGPRLTPHWGETAETDGLPEPLRVLAALSGIARIERRWHDEDLPPETVAKLRRFLLERFWAALDASLEPSRGRRGRLRSKPVVRILDEDQPADLGIEVAPGRLDLDVGLPLRWLLQVWGRGAAVADGSLVLDCGDVGDGALGAWLLRWSLGGRSGRMLVPELTAARLEADDDRVWHVVDGDVDPPTPRPWWSVKARTRPG